MYSLSGAGWKPDKTMQAFCKWFKPQEKGIKLSDKYKAIYFAIAFPEIKHYGAAVYFMSFLLMLPRPCSPLLK